MGTRRSGKSFAELFPHLFLVPGLLVAFAVGMVWVLFYATAQDTRSIAELIQDIQSGGEHSRKQDAHALAIRILELFEEGKPRYFSEEETKALLNLLDRFPEDDELHEFIILAVGRAGQPKMTLPVLVAIAGDRDRPGKVRANAISGLGYCRSLRAVEPLLGLLEEFSDGPDEWELRMRSIWALVQLYADARGEPGARLAGERIVRAIRGDVHSPRRELSWNTAYYLAAYFQDASGVDILRKLLDWEYLDRQRGDHNRPLTVEEKERWMQLALKGIYAVEGEDALDAIRAKTKDRSLKVRDTAFRILALHEERMKAKEKPPEKGGGDATGARGRRSGGTGGEAVASQEDSGGGGR